MTGAVVGKGGDGGKEVIHILRRAPIPSVGDATMVSKDEGKFLRRLKLSLEKLVCFK